MRLFRDRSNSPNEERGTQKAESICSSRSTKLNDGSTDLMTSAEYWSFLCAAAVLAIASAWPRRATVSDQSPQSGVSDTSGSSDQRQRVQDSRIHERGRGRRASTPSEIPARGWKDVLLRVYNNVGEDRVLLVAAGVTFYSLLSIFPGIADNKSYGTLGAIIAFMFWLWLATTVILMGAEIDAELEHQRQFAIRRPVRRSRLEPVGRRWLTQLALLRNNRLGGVPSLPVCGNTRYD